jgi:hypothetical protein
LILWFRRFPGLLARMLMSVAFNIVDTDHMQKFSFITKTLSEEDEIDVLDDGQLCKLERNFEDTLRWKSKYLYKINSWLDDYLANNN